MRKSISSDRLAITLMSADSNAEGAQSCRIHSELLETFSWQIGPPTILPTEDFNGPNWTGLIGLWIGLTGLPGAKEGISWHSGSSSRMGRKPGFLSANSLSAHPR